MDPPHDFEVETGLREGIYQAVHNGNYKHGAFKTQITPSTDSLAAIKIFVDSPITTTPEKTKLRWIRQAILHHRRNSSKSRNTLEVILTAMAWLTNILAGNLSKPRIPVRPTIIQSYNPDGTIYRTAAYDHTSEKVTMLPGVPDLEESDEDGPATGAQANKDKQEESKNVEKKKYMKSGKYETTD
jgi:hypothetical protein